MVRPATVPGGGPSRSAWWLVWLAVALHVAGLVVDSIFHGSDQRPFGALEMLGAHGLSYLGAGVAILGARYARRVAVGAGRAATAIAAVGVIQALALAADFVTEVSDIREDLSAGVYVLSIPVLGVLASHATKRRPSRPLLHNSAAEGDRAQDP